jgi:Tfp pilus assembly protein FimV
MRGKLLEPAQKADEHGKKQIQAYLDRKEQERIALEHKLQQEAEAKARADAAAQQAAMDPFDLLEAVDAPPAPAVVPAVSIAPQKYAGISTAKKPMTAQVVDLRKFLEFAIKPENWPFMEVYIALDMKALKVQAQRLGDAMEQKFPGIKAVQEQSLRLK